ncbi:hypothetical protein [Paenibacillus donghaensis]|uniref:Uncharacterized protein n=1 Tax=Paenibacillus donghaensis TaxID=414771 RepID=A0A2Z2KIM2_9BACL|nr:hypothetical protein [Paenibacillus donghaensis]ASA22099.1 hypothetical protein B9T62_15725 [Paenibacillus donghaensis]
MEKPLRIIDEYHDHPRPGYMVPARSLEQGGYFIQVPPIQQSDEETSIEYRWTKQDIYAYFGVPAEILKTVKANECKYEELYREWIKNNGALIIGIDLATKPDQTVFRKGE